MRTTRFAAIALAVAALAACQGNGAPDAFTSADSLAVDSVRVAWQAAYNAGDAAAAAALYDSNAVDMGGDQPTIEGRAAIQQALATQMAATPHTRFEVMPASHFVGRGNMAISTGPYHMMMGDSASAMTYNGKYLTVVRRAPDGRWRLHFISYSMDAPMPAPAPAPGRRR